AQHKGVPRIRGAQRREIHSTSMVLSRTESENPWRPRAHIRPCSGAMIAFIQAADKGEVYNLSLTSNCARPESRDVRRFSVAFSRLTFASAAKIPLTCSALR